LFVLQIKCPAAAAAATVAVSWSHKLLWLLLLLLAAGIVAPVYCVPRWLQQI